MKDICCRLHSNVKLSYKCNHTHILKGITKAGLVIIYDINTNGITTTNVENIKPYLFPISSITEEQEIEFRGLLSEVYDFSFRMEELLESIQSQKDIPFRFIDWLVQNNFDYRGLIPKDLAINATNLNIY